MRAFVALELPEPLVAALGRLQAGLSVGKPVPQDNLHLTLAFLGDITEAQARDLALALDMLRAPAIDLALAGLDLFGGRRPGVLFAVANGAGLERLHDKVSRAAREAGIARPRERFRPHVTLARLGAVLSPRDQQRLGEFLSLNARFAAGPERAGTMTLYRSHLRPEGALHEPLADFPLTGQEGQ